MRDRLSLALRKTRALGVALLTSFVLIGCGTTPEVTSYVHPVSGRRTDVIAQNLLDAPGNNRELLWLNAYRDFEDRYQYKYYLEVIYGARPEVGYLEIMPGRSLTIIA